MSDTGSDLLGPRPGRRLVRPTLRLKLTLLYGSCFIVAGAGLLGITYALFSNATAPAHTTFVHSRRLTIPAPGALKGGLQAGSTGNANRRVAPKQAVGGTIVSGGKKPAPGFIEALRKSGQRQINVLVRTANGAIAAQRSRSRSSLLAESGIALAVMALLSIGLGWLLAGRALGPLRTMNRRARKITEDTLHERLGGSGRQDELGELAATFDAVLARLERAFEAQRGFVANASHELRTPITLERALLEVALADPEASVESLRHTCERVLVAGEQQERVIDALLTLARGQAGVESVQPVRLDELVRRQLEDRAPHLEGFRVDSELQPVTVNGAPALLERLVSNLLDNATVHNASVGPWMDIRTSVSGGRAELRVANGGTAVPAERVSELFEPFRRLEGERTGTDRGLGLGLSIVRAVAQAHGGEAEAIPLPGGGLELIVRLALAAPMQERRDAYLHSSVDASTDELLAGSDRHHR